MYEMNVEGYKRAKAYLKKINKLEEFLRNGFSTDGYSLVYYANEVKNVRDI
jgi:hypothetical protein